VKNLQIYLATIHTRKVKRVNLSIEIDLSKPPLMCADVYLRLQLLSHRIIKPHGIKSQWNALEFFLI
jgi:tetrahydrodipicolinate N-succinyltransferase